MDLQSFLESGLIEAYVVGQGSAAERAEVEQMAAQHPEVRAEMAAAEQALEQFALSNAVNPPAWMKGRILDLVGREAAPGAPPSTPTIPPPSAKTHVSPFLTWGLAAAALLALVGWWRLNTQNGELQNTVNTLRQETADCATQRQQTEALRQRVAFLSDPTTRHLSMKDKANNTAIAYFNHAACQVSVDVATLPSPTTTDRYYQVWAVVNGVPQSMGMIRLDGSTDWQTFTCVHGATAYAISEEDKPEGNPTPTSVRFVGPLEG